MVIDPSIETITFTIEYLSISQQMIHPHMKYIKQQYDHHQVKKPPLMLTCQYKVVGDLRCVPFLHTLLAMKDHNTHMTRKTEVMKQRNDTACS